MPGAYDEPGPDDPRVPTRLPGREPKRAETETKPKPKPRKRRRSKKAKG